MIFDRIEWDDANLDHATKRLTAAEIEQALWNADRMRQHPQAADRAIVTSVTDGGQAVTIVVQLLHNGVRPITGWRN